MLSVPGPNVPPGSYDFVSHVILHIDERSVLKKLATARNFKVWVN